MFWIHEFYGSGGSEMLGPDLLVINDVVLVITNYRVRLLRGIS